ncbi:MAG: hypothetical protein ACFFD4_35315 [Candidatus Odinarchaeota archaeon]
MKKQPCSLPFPLLLRLLLSMLFTRSPVLASLLVALYPITETSGDGEVKQSHLAHCKMISLLNTGFSQ